MMASPMESEKIWQIVTNLTGPDVRVDSHHDLYEVMVSNNQSYAITRRAILTPSSKKLERRRIKRSLSKPPII